MGRRKRAFRPDKELRAERPHLAGDTTNAQQPGTHWRHYPARSVRNATIARVLKKKPSNRSGLDWWHLGEYQIVNGLLDDDEALISSGEEALVEGSLIDNPHPACLIDLGWILFDRGNPAQAKKNFVEALRIDDRSRDAWAFLALTEIALSNRDKALEAFENAARHSQARQHETDLIAIELLKASQEIPDELRKNTKILKFSLNAIEHFSPDDQAKALRYLLRNCLGSGITPEYEKRIRDDLCEVCYAGIRDLHETIKTCEESIDFLDSSETPHLLMGLACAKLGNKRKAIQSYTRCLELDPENLLAITNLSDLLLQEGQADRAYKTLRSIKEPPVEMESGNYFNNLGNAIAEMGLSILDELQCREKADLCNRKNPKFALNYVFSLIVNGEISKARDRLSNSRKMIVDTLGDESIEIHEQLIKAAISAKDPMELLAIHHDLVPILGLRDTAFLLLQAWQKRMSFETVTTQDGEHQGRSLQSFEYGDFLGELGIRLGEASKHAEALACWRELQSIPGHNAASWNIPVSLDALGMHQEAVESLQTATGDCVRKNTITANVLGRTDPEQAFEYYLRALKEDESFLLPIENCFDLALRLNRRECLPGLIEALGRVEESTERDLLSARIELERGYLLKSSEYLERVIRRNDSFMGPKELQDRLRLERKDPTLLGGFDVLKIYKQLARIYLIAERHDDLAELIASLAEYLSEMDGDWRVLMSISLSIQDKVDDAISVLSGMDDQPPAMLAKSYAYLQAGDFGCAFQACGQIQMEDRDLDGFFFALCLPSAFRFGLEAICFLNDGDAAKACLAAEEAITRDPASRWLTDIFLRCLDATGRSNEITDFIADQFKHASGNTKLFRRLINGLIYQSRIEECAILMNSFCDSADDKSREEVGDLQATVSVLTTALSHRQVEIELPQWSEYLDDQGITYLKQALYSEKMLEEQGDQCGILLSRFCEHMLKQYFFFPLCNRVEPSECIPWERARNASAYLCTRRGPEPTMGDIIALVSTMGHPLNRQNRFISMMLRATYELPINADLLLTKQFTEALRELRDYRNKIMHATPASLDEYLGIKSFVLGSGSGGDFVRCLCGTGV